MFWIRTICSTTVTGCQLGTVTGCQLGPVTGFQLGPVTGCRLGHLLCHCLDENAR